VINELKCGVLPEFVLRQLIPADAVAIDGKEKLGFSVMVVVARINKPHSGVQESDCSGRFNHVPLGIKRSAAFDRAIAAVFGQFHLSYKPSLCEL
jgi:hypothetical protein